MKSFAKKYGPWALVTGASSGMGTEFAKRLAESGVNIDENPQAPSGFNINSIPAVLLFKEGKVVDTLIGVQSKDQYAAALQRSAV
jgi:thioredoxin 1